MLTESNSFLCCEVAELNRTSKTSYIMIKSDQGGGSTKPPIRRLFRINQSQPSLQITISTITFAVGFVDCIKNAVMYDLFFQQFNKRIPLTAEEEEVIKGYLSVKKIRRRQYLLQEGDVCKAAAFVEQGALRAYTLDKNGTEHIVQFAVEGWHISDMYSFLTGEPATYNIDAIEDSSLVVLSRSAVEELQKVSPKFLAFQLQAITNAYIALQKRMTSAISLSLDERYQNLIKTYPNIVQRVPQHMLASYLGAKPETLSRVRNRRVSK
jgi:CRP-like cAMP-binding protein